MQNPHTGSGVTTKHPMVLNKRHQKKIPPTIFIGRKMSGNRSKNKSQSRSRSRDGKVSNKKMSGMCKRFFSNKGYGFITLDDGSGDVFVHQTDIYAQGFRSLAEGELVEFDIKTQNDGRRKAINVTGPNGNFVKGSAK
eukprot:503884_1